MVIARALSFILRMGRSAPPAQGRRRGRPLAARTIASICCTDSNPIPRPLSRPLEGLDYEVVRNPVGYTIASVHGIRINGERLEGDDPDALCHAMPGALLRVLPRWYADGWSISLYFAGGRLLPAKTRVFVDFVVDAFERERLAPRILAC